MLCNRLLTCALALWALYGQPLALAQPTQVTEHHWQNVPKVVAFGDVHGAYQQLHDALNAAGLIDPMGNWRGGTTHLVSLGDLLDRGADSRKVMDLLMRLQEQAHAAGGRVHVVLGNHEVMNLTGDLRYVAAGEYAAFADAPLTSAEAPAAPAQESANPTAPRGYANHRRAFARDGKYGRWLLQLPLLVQIDHSLFVHGGLPPLLARESIADVNARYRGQLMRLLALGERLHSAGRVDPSTDLLGQARTLLDWLQLPDNAEADPQLVSDIEEFVQITQSELFGWQSPNWYRGTAICAEPVEGSVLNAALARQGAKRVVVGHTPTSTRRVQQRFDGRAVLADTGMLKPYYHGQASLVFIAGNSLSVQYPALGPARKEPDLVPVFDRSDAAIEALFASAPLPDAAAEPFEIESVRATFERGNTRTNNAKVAAYRLSRLLGWDLVPVTVDRGKGVLVALPKQSLSEAQRITANAGRPNHCAVGNAYQLMYAFDALIQNEQRTAETILYDQVSWRLLLSGHGSAFGRSRSLPKYLTAQPKQLPGAVIDRLRALTAAELTEALAPLLSEPQVKALLKRRDNLVRNWEPLSLTP